MCLCTWCRSARQVHLPVIKGTADDRILSRLQHHVTSYELLHRALAVCHQTTQDQLIPVPKRGPEDHDAQIQQVTVGRVRTPGGVTELVFLLFYDSYFFLYLSVIDLLPSWKRANSSAVLSRTVRAVTVTGLLARQGKQPCRRTSCQSV